MKNLILKFVVTIVVSMLGIGSVSAHNTSKTSNPAAGLDLYAVAEVFKVSENIAKFEEALNAPDSEINNLDLNENGEIDFIRTTEQVKDDTHLIVLQVPLGENDFQDVATIAVERESGDKYNLQIQGETTIYGENYYVVPANNNFSLWNVVRSIFSPNYRPYISSYNYRVLPNWWKIRHPVAVNLYQTRVGVFANRRNFVATKTVTVKSIAKVNYRPRTSTIVTRKATVTKTNTTVRPNSSEQNRVVKTTQTQTKTNPNTNTTNTRTRTEVTKRKKN